MLCSFCDTYHKVDEVVFLDIEEDPQGRDKMTFYCPVAGEEKVLTSQVYSR